MVTLFVNTLKWTYEDIKNPHYNEHNLEWRGRAKLRYFTYYLSDPKLDVGRRVINIACIRLLFLQDKNDSLHYEEFSPFTSKQFATVKS